MRTAIVHDADADPFLGDRILDSLRNIWPDARAYVVRRSGEAGSWIADLSETGTQLYAAPSAQQRTRGRLGVPDAELVVSTSARAANLVRSSQGVPHICYLTATPRPDVRQSAAGPSGSLRDFPRVMAAFQLSSVPAEEGVWENRETLPRHGVTGFVAGCPSVAKSIGQQTGETPELIPPPVATSRFRTSLVPRSEFYVTVLRDGGAADLEFVVEACRLTNRKLIVLSAGPVPTCYSSPAYAHVRFIAAGSEGVRHEHYCRCRGVISAGDVDFDPAVIEAQASGAPVIVYGRSGAAETVIDSEGAGQGTGLFFQERSAENIASAMSELERRPHKCCASIAAANAARYSAARFEQQMRFYADAQVSRQQSRITAAAATQSMRDAA